MARRVFLHVGLPKTGTTYLQSILWEHRAVLADQDVLLPGFGPRQHLWASCVVREEPRIARRHPDAPQAWEQLTEEVRSFPGTAIISHEFFAGASADQVARAVADLGGAEVHVVVTAREIVGLLTARWQEWVKNGATGPVDAYPPSERVDPGDEWGWGTLDLADVLRRWGSGVPAERVHLIPLPGRDQPRDELWRRFAGVVGIDPDSCDTSASQPNESLGVAEVELLRRVNAHLTDFTAPVDKGMWIRGYLAQEKLVPRRGERFWPSPERVAVLRARGEAGLDDIAGRGYDVVGDLDDLRTPEALPERRHPDSVSDGEVLDVAAATIAEMLSDVRRLKRRPRPAPGPWGRARRRLARSARQGRMARLLRRSPRR
ncbi:hypothetical protein [Nocardioides donggukensis]|uniref:Sulfotransferase family protein n=1 Tax=Nocardioides donggukensis TaxID=2774019 RepID=A0A927Q2C4_9ACTN|nr:hypothetical protein [Nocardioides donggukensis]MBD8870254.1 hypothetical protein [Nocardioides donggukensis]